MIIDQISDLHMVAGNAERRARLERVVALLGAGRPRPDLVVVTGDLADDGREESYREVGAILAGLDRPLRAVPGNRDHRANLRKVLGDFLPANGEGFLHYAEEVGGLRLIGLDSGNPPSQRGGFCFTRQVWLEGTLAEAPATPTLLMLHHSPFPTRMRDGSIGRQMEDADALESILARHPQVIGLLCGHLHRAETTLFAGRPAWSGPSVAYQEPETAIRRYVF